MQKLTSTGFTLIELLISACIISVLAAVALVNLSEAQARAKLARVKADVRTISAALESYHVDCNAYPPAAVNDEQIAEPLDRLTSPRMYLTSVPHDPFGRAHFDFSTDVWMLGYNYKDAASTTHGMLGETYGRIWLELPTRKYMLHSCGPNQRWDVTPYCGYDATNGTVSNGDICVFGPLG
jgi:prepilin-type N-terminal cleavage/methylation domain-containing protein